MTIKFRHQVLNLLITAASSCIKVLGPNADKRAGGLKALCAFHKIVFLGARAHESDAALAELIVFCKSLGFGSALSGGDDDLPYFDAVLFTFLHTCEATSLELIYDFADSLKENHFEKGKLMV